MLTTHTPTPVSRRILNGALSLTVVGFLLGVAPVTFSQDYIGSEACAECHADIYSDWTASGHPYKLMPSDEARNRPIPLPEGFDTWDEITYVIGGFKWKSRYMGEDGYIITETRDGPGRNQFNYFSGTWSDYHAGEMKPYDCGRCHTTGWVADEDFDTDGTLADNQDGLEGIHGTFEVGGIHCEQCHGPGGNGFDAAKQHGFIDDSSAACGTCHIRDDANTIPAKGGFIRHHEQYNELLASPHANLDCVSCHDPHKRGDWSITTTCETCHADEADDYMETTMYAVGVECTDCHMAMATKSSEARGEYQGDVMTHLFTILTDPDEQDMFTPDGGFVLLDGDGKGSINLDFSCKQCHPNKTTEWLATYAKDFHGDVFIIGPGLSGNWWGGPDRDGEGWVIEVADGVFVASFYTYDGMGNQAWVIGPGVPDGNMVTVDLEIAIEGPTFGSGYDPEDSVRVPWGTAKFTFHSCTSATVVLTPNADMIALGYEAITIELTRLTTPAVNCPTGIQTVAGN